MRRLEVIAIAIVKPIKVRRGNIAGLRAVIDYVVDGEKTNNGTLVYMHGGLAGREYQDMVLCKKLFGKTTGRQYAHFIQSFHANDDISSELAYKIGQEYIAGLKQWDDFQVLMAVHTNTEHMHIHYIVNSVSIRDGTKWQCSRQDLKDFRGLSDTLCRKYNLHVIEHGKRGHRSYGEHTAYQAGISWKTLLASDIAGCLQQAKSRADFLHRLDERGIDADFGTKNIMFTVRAGTYGLKKDMMCSNYKLMSYGDYSKENIYNHFNVNKGLLELAFDDVQMLQNALLEIGRRLFPDNPTELQDIYLGGLDIADFDRMTRDEIEAYLKRKKLEQLQKKALLEHEKQSLGSGVILETITETLEMIIALRNEQRAEQQYAGIQLYDELDLERDYEYEI